MPFGKIEYKVITEPIIEPITVDELKLYARIDGTDEDTLLTTFIKAARQGTEKYLGRKLIEQIITTSLDCWNYYVFKLPIGNLISLVEVRTVDESNISTVYDSGNYYIRDISDPAEIVIKQGTTYPSNTARDKGGYEIEYKAGYGDEAEDVPDAIREVIKMWAALIYENRVPIDEPPDAIKTLLHFYKIIKI
jgi:uncharacterized phiE125 gp8 family phage protein